MHCSQLYYLFGAYIGWKPNTLNPRSTQPDGNFSVILVDNCSTPCCTIWPNPIFGRSTFGRDSFKVPNLVDTRVLADTYLVDIVFWSTLCFGRHFGLVEPHLVLDNPVNRRSIRLSCCLRSKVALIFSQWHFSSNCWWLLLHQFPQNSAYDPDALYQIP